MLGDQRLLTKFHPDVQIFSATYWLHLLLHHMSQDQPCKPQNGLQDQPTALLSHLNSMQNLSKICLALTLFHFNIPFVWPDGKCDITMIGCIIWKTQTPDRTIGFRTGHFIQINNRVKHHSGLQCHKWGNHASMVSRYKPQQNKQQLATGQKWEILANYLWHMTESHLFTVSLITRKSSFERTSKTRRKCFGTEAFEVFNPWHFK